MSAVPRTPVESIQFLSPSVGPCDLSLKCSPRLSAVAGVLVWKWHPGMPFCFAFLTTDPLSNNGI